MIPSTIQGAGGMGFGPSLPLSLRNLPPHHRMVANLLAAYRSLSPTERVAARAWYRRAYVTFIQPTAAAAPCSPETVAAIAAAASCKRSWLVTQELTRAIILGTRRERSRALRACSPAGRRMIRAILRNPVDPLPHATGPKVSAFARALAGDQSAVVIDRHMIRAATGFNGKPGGEATIRRIAAALDSAARSSGILPAQFQAAVWVAVRGTAQ